MSNMEITREIRKTLREIKKKYGQVSVSWIRYKFHISFDEAQKILKGFEK